MIERITQDELQLLECLSYPISASECIFDDLENATHNDSESNLKCGNVRFAQFPMMNFEYLLDDDPNLSYKENFKLHEGMGNIDCFGGRNFGKTWIVEVIDMLIACIWLDNIEAGFTSTDSIHIRAILEEKLIPILIRHPFYQMMNPKINRSPNYKIAFPNGFTLIGINMNVASKSPGQNFFGKHLKRLYIEEASFETLEVYNKRIDARSELGCVTRSAGMTTFTPYMPAGKRFYALSNRPWICNLPQYCLVEGTQVLMSDLSLRNIEDLNIGDEIFSFTEESPFILKKNKVLNKIFQGEKEVFSLKVGERIIEATDNHEFLIRRGEWDKYWKSTDSIDQEKDSLYFSKHFCSYGNDYYEGVFLGVLETEANLKKKIYTLGQKDEIVSMEWLLNKLNIKFTKKQCNQVKDFYRFYILTENYNRIQDLKKNLFSNKEKAYGFIAGCFLADGCINVYTQSNGKKKIQVTLGQKNKNKIIEDVLDFLNVYYSKFEVENECFVYLFPRMELPLYIPYSKKIKKLSENISESTLKCFSSGFPKIEKIGLKKVWDITTGEKTFIANGFVVHNCNPNWGDKEKQEALIKHGGENSISYRVYVKGEVVEDGISVFDMERVKRNYLDDKVIKHIEITKKNFGNYKELLVVDRPNGVEEVYIAADIGESAPTEIAIFFRRDGIYRYSYNITVHNLTDKEQPMIFMYLTEKLKANYIGMDTTDGTGRSIFRTLAENYPSDNLVWCSFTDKIDIGFKTEKKNDVEVLVRDSNGNPVFEQEYVSEWSIKRLKELFYEERMAIPLDHKLDVQLNSVISTISSSRTVYSVMGEEDHLFAAFRVFAIMQWNCEFKNSKPMNTKKFGKSGA